jgi:hypothetical protein
MSCEGWNDGDKCNLQIENASINGIVISVDSMNHKLLIEYSRASALIAKMKGLNESTQAKNTFWIDAHSVTKVMKHGE